jgi:hypothetical protein
MLAGRAEQQQHHNNCTVCMDCLAPAFEYLSTVVDCAFFHVMQVCVSLPPEALLASGWGQLAPGAALVVSAPGMTQLQVPLTDPAAPAAPSQLK